MKRPTLALKQRQARVAAYRARTRRARKTKRWAPTENKYVEPREFISAPQKFDLIRGSGVAVAKFLRAVAAAVLKKAIPVKLDFRHTESFYPAATILLFAEIDRIVSLSILPKPITIIEPKLRRPREVLKQIGLFEVTKDNSDIIPEREDVVYWKATKGHDQSGENLAILEAIAEKVNSTHVKQLELSGVWRGVTEAVANSVEHAYKKPRDDGFAGLPDTRWWMFTQLRDGVFTIAVCDLGCGYRATINETLPETFIREFLARFRGKNRDVFAIQTAMEYGRSGTKKAERGKGSRDAMSVVQKHGHGELMIVSNTGSVHYSYSGVEQVQQSQSSLGIDIRGTIVWWKLPLKEALHDHG